MKSLLQHYLASSGVITQRLDRARAFLSITLARTSELLGSKILYSCQLQDTNRNSSSQNIEEWKKKYQETGYVPPADWNYTQTPYVYYKGETGVWLSGWLEGQNTTELGPCKEWLTNRTLFIVIISTYGTPSTDLMFFSI